MDEFETSTDACNLEWRSSSQVRCLESEMDDLGAKFRCLESGMDEFEPSSMFGIGNGCVRAKFRSLESGMEEFE